ncbi:Limit dextrin alpha-1,6-maltotetraose-hydrolase [Saccharolobus shibatae B12]|uniref:Glycogen debranching enzyme n=1 Tax=Saccharolobus shibatae (strain ATCC 51178 / DSM 5389 / JCM 8931 / NBRC 15437 / B12) TaxID=523848 RepID=Q8NKQ3_SACSH|nr:glycogen debranching protein GlgX [Saccharolobus shibatae]AAM81590.1 glycogen debranching enzyme [Saccharolobus shibatae B12]QXJ29377.1 Limit dextrin alpha-1,6-maltotetraose-hydrolase [Saccharolobus shibatae B12]
MSIFFRTRDRPLRPGDPYPLGSNWIEDEDGVNFSLFSENAEKVELFLYSQTNQKYPKEIIEVKNKTGDIWHVFIPGLRPGQLYAYRVYGPYKPELGLRFNPNKVLIDPYAKAINGNVIWNDAVFGYKIGDQNQDLSYDERDSSEYVPKSVVINPYFEWDDENFIKGKKVPLKDTVIYEVHVKGFTKLRLDLPENLRGTYEGLASEQMISYLKDLGITTVELMPVFHFIDQRFLIDKGLTNYWGYDPINFFSPECRYSSSGCLGEQVISFKRMVNKLHNAGIEVIIDVVYNHTAEGNHLGPTLSFRGIDNTAYYMLQPDNKRYYLDFTGTGNTLNLSHPRVIQMVLDSLRYWVTEMHVDGFRFDLAAALARELYSVNMLNTFFIALQQDPILSQVKLIAEPWDVGQGGYQVGNFPYQWAEWNGKYRDSIRRFWRGEALPYSEIANRLLGSPDIYLGNNKTPFASINYVTSHDGFTLEDLVSYNQKHNEANGFNNQDGMNENYSWNCGTEGTTNDQNVIMCREKQKRNFMITLLVSQGTPMILGGDELSRTQRGNNNAFCQDNEITWFDWNLDERKSKFLEFVKKMIQFYKAHPVFRRERYFQGKKLFGMPLKDVTFYTSDGKEVDEKTWNSPTQTVIFVLEGSVMDEINIYGERIADDSFLIILNANPNNVKVKFPKGKWELVVGSYLREIKPEERIVDGEKELEIEGRTALVYRRTEL